MNEKPGGIYVAGSAEAFFVRVIGRGGYRNSRPLRELGQRLLQQGCTQFYVDLGQCEGLDSTFLGMLAGFGMALRDKGRLHIYNTTGRNLNSLQNLGLDQLARIDADTPEELRKQLSPDAEFEQLPGTDLNTPTQSMNKVQTAELMLACHEDLCRADARNEALFSNVKQFLREDLARLRAEKAPGTTNPTNPST